ncbi:MAG: WD40 repeat domain-containing protein [Alphaproteobacteria bacterium]|nr:WD40 repeat domain-containing protein [Alphaproteobacteria bacterium]
MTAVASSARPGTLIEMLGRTWSVGAPVSATVFNGTGTRAAFVLGDGSVALARCDASDNPLAQTQTKSDGTIEISPSQRPTGPLMRPLAQAKPGVSLAADALSGFLGGGEDGVLFRLEQDGEIAELASFDDMPVGCVAAAQNGDLHACAVGRTVHLYADHAAEPLASLQHDHPVAALAFDSKGKRIAAAHEGGITVWPTDASNAEPKRLSRAGSHTAVAWSPDNRFIASIVTDNGLHAWRLRGDAELDLSGFVKPPANFAWAHKSRFLVSDGNPQVTCWAIAGANGKLRPRTEHLGIASGILVTSVACHPQHNTIAAGYANGAVLLCRYGKPDVVLVKEAGDGAVRTLSWSADGDHLALGSEHGFAAVVSFPAGLFK